jgi:Arc/MetJ family transcription regulator
MRTNIEIDDEIMDEAQRLTGVPTKRETVDLALRELVARHRRLGMLELSGRVHSGGRPQRKPARAAVIVVDTSVWIDVLGGRRTWRRAGAWS